MSTLARDFHQDNLITISRILFRQIRDAIKKNHLRAFTKDAWCGGDKYGWIMKTEVGSSGKYLLVEHYEKKAEGGLAVSYKVDRAMLDAFEALKKS